MAANVLPAGRRQSNFHDRARAALSLHPSQPQGEARRCSQAVSPAASPVASPAVSQCPRATAGGDGAQLGQPSEEQAAQPAAAATLDGTRGGARSAQMQWLLQVIDIHMHMLQRTPSARDAMYTT